MAWTLRAGERSRRREAPEPTPDPAAERPRRRQPVVDLVADLPGTTLVLVCEPESLAALPDGLDRADVRLVHLWEHEVPLQDPAADPAVDPAVDPEADPAAVAGWESVLLVTLDRATLRRAASELPDVGAVADLAVWLAGSRTPLVAVPRLGWTPLRHLESLQVPRPGRGTWLRLGHVRPVRAQRMLHEVALQAVPGVGPVRSGLVTAYEGRRPVPGLDLHAARLADPSEAVDPERVVPPDVVVTLPGHEVALPAHHVVDRPPLLVTDPGIEPVDEHVFSPRGWRRDPTEGEVDLVDVLTHGVVTEQVLRRLRNHCSVRVDLAATPAHELLKLTMAGIPTRVTGHEPRLAPQLAGLLAQVPDLDDALVREGWSVKLRRATFDHHSTLAWRHGLAVRAGLDRLVAGPAGLPGVSVLLATKREEELEGAVARVAAQVGADVELVVATHGFTADPARLAELLGREPVLLSFGADVLFGDVLTGAAQAASHDVVMKMDDDDWYSPHTVHDLLMARRYTGADVVGSPAEFVHLAETDETVRRSHPTECWTTFVAGGTLMLSKDVLREVGWFRPVRRWVDGQLLSMVLASGGSVYRTHGLNYVLVRHGRGHTWTADHDTIRAADMLDRSWPGFRHPEEAL